MSVTFNVRGLPSSFETGENYVNFSNVNARDILAMAGFAVDDLCGEWTGEDLDVAIPNLIKALNANVDYTREGYTDGRLIECGSPDESTRRRLRGLLQICFLAKTSNDSVVFG
jgi:hypothetical protein